MRNPRFNQPYKLCAAVAVLMLATGFARSSAGADGPAAPATQPVTPPAPGARGGARGGATTTVAPLATAVAVELAPPLDKDGNFKVSPKGGWNTVRRIAVPADVPKGEVINFQLQSSDSKFYPRSVATRQIWVYIPAGYKEGDVLPLMVDHDGGANSVVQTQMIAAMDLLIHDKKIPMMAGLFVANGGNARGQEYDTPSGKFAEFLEAEVIPAAEKAAKIKVTKNPDARGTIGQSSGGAAALAMAWYHNDLYHRVISYSGSFTQLQRHRRCTARRMGISPDADPQFRKKAPAHLDGSRLEMTSTTTLATGESPTTIWLKYSKPKATTTNTSGPKAPATSKAASKGRRCWRRWSGCGKGIRRNRGGAAV